MSRAKELTARGTYFSDKLSFLQFLAAVMVVAIHTTTVAFGTHKPENIFEKIQYFGYVNISAWAVPFFFAVSAFMLFRNYTPSDTKKVYCKKGFRLILPFVIWSIFYEMLSVINGAVANPDYTFNLKNAVINILLYKTNYALWFLPMLILCILLCPIIYVAIKNKKVGILTLMAVAALNFVPAVPAGVHPDALLYYILGAYLGMHYTEQTAKRKSRGAAMMFLIIFIAECIVYTIAEGSFKGMKFIHRLILLTAVWNMTDLLDVMPKHKYYDTTYFIYLFHVFVVYCINISLRLVYNIVTNNSAPFNLLLLYFAKIALTTFIAVLAGCFVKKYMKRLWFFLTGEDVVAVKQ